MRTIKNITVRKVKIITEKTEWTIKMNGSNDSIQDYFFQDYLNTGVFPIERMEKAKKIIIDGEEFKRDNWEIISREDSFINSYDEWIKLYENLNIENKVRGNCYYSFFIHLRTVYSYCEGDVTKIIYKNTDSAVDAFLSHKEHFEKEF